MNEITTIEKAMQVFDGTMLGDNGLGYHGDSAQMQIAKSGEQYMPYLRHLRDVLGLLDIQPCTGHPKSFQATSRGKRYVYCRLESRVSPFLLGQRCRWYPNGKKIIPKDVRVTPISMAYLFMDDGCTSWKQGNQVQLCLSTNNFTEENVYRLRDLIEVRLGVQFCPQPHSKAEPHDSIELWLRKIDEVNLFLDWIKPYIHPSYMYKVKRPWYRGGQADKETNMQKEFNELRNKLRVRNS